MSMKIGLAAGHSGRTEGERLWEYRLCRRAEVALTRSLQGCRHEVISPMGSMYDMVNDVALREKIGWFNRNKVDIAVELHINAGGGEYSTVIYEDDSVDGKRLAQCISTQLIWLKNFAKWTSIGARPQSYFNRSLAFLRDTKMPAVIVEPGFKDNNAQRAFFDTQTSAIVYAELVHIGIESYGAGRANE